MAYNSDGYIMLDFTEVDFRRTNQTIDGLFKRCVDVIGTNKFILVINANGRTPLPATCSFTNNQYVIDTCIYMFAISSNDNLFIRRNDVPASDIIDDSSISVDKTWSSNKIDSELDTKADASALADYQPLLTAGTNITIDENNVISSTGGAVIDDSVIVNNKVWSSLNTVEKLAPIDTIINNPAEFNTSLALPLVECSTSFKATQEGTGDPSPDNIRNFVLINNFDINANGVINNISLNNYYSGGDVNIVKSKLLVTWLTKTYTGSEAWAETTIAYYFSEPQMKSGNKQAGLANWIPTSENNGITFGINNRAIYISKSFLSAYNINSITEFKSYLNLHNLVVLIPRNTNVEIDLSNMPIISTIAGANSIESDTGNIKVSYKYLPEDLF